MSQESVLPPSTDLVPETAGRRRVRLPVLGAQRRRPRDDLLLSAVGLPRSVADGVSRLAAGPVLRALRSLAAVAEAADRRPRARHPSDDAVLGRRRFPWRVWRGWALRPNTATRAWAPICSARRRAGWPSAVRLVGVLRTSIPHFFRRTGWALCGQASYRRADARALLARLLDRGLIPRPRRRLHIRPWLQWEQAGLQRIYNQNVLPQEKGDAGSAAALVAAGRKLGAIGRQPPGGRSTAYGPLERTSAYWQWLLNRHGYDQLYVALEGPEQLELGEISTAHRRLCGDPGRADYGTDGGARIVRGRRPSCWPAAAATPSSTTGTACCFTLRRRVRCSRFSTRPAAAGRRGRRSTARCT